MNSKKAIIPPRYQKILMVGKNIKLTRKFRKLTVEQVSERAGIHGAALHPIEKRDPFKLPPPLPPHFQKQPSVHW